ncbi:MAG: phosphate ABC transporter ATP-binding protein [Gammaproteobacteria bacterium]
MTQRAKLEILQSGAPQNSVVEIRVSSFNAWFHNNHVLNDINVSFQRQSINCIIGPSGSGKSTLIRSINRINDVVEGFACEGTIHFSGKNINSKSLETSGLRTDIGMVFQKPCVFPKSIFDNVLFGLQHLKKLSPQQRGQIVEDNLKRVSLWKDVSHRLGDQAASLSLGQQQRLCIARTLAIKPRVILFDEPTSSLDPVSAGAIESLMLELKNKYTIIFVTHNIRQAERIADYLIFMCDGRIIEQGEKEKLFTAPDKKQTKSYLNDEYCEC